MTCAVIPLVFWICRCKIGPEKLSPTSNPGNAHLEDGDAAAAEKFKDGRFRERGKGLGFRDCMLAPCPQKVKKHENRNPNGILATSRQMIYGPFRLSCGLGSSAAGRDFP